MMNCPLCTTQLSSNISSNKFNHCNTCDLVFRSKGDFISQAEEKKHYEHHQNGPQHAGYLDFLKRAITPIALHLQRGLDALDYGCGPGPALDFMLKDYGIKCDNYDPFFFPDGIKKEQYDFIFATECLEHFHDPREELENIFDLLGKGGLLSIMTDMHQGIGCFPDWYYVKDPTHVVFYSLNTMNWIADQFGLKLIFCDQKRVCVFEK